MGFTEEPPGLKWINNINMASFGPLVTQFLWAVGSLAFTWAACVLLLRLDGPSATNGIPTSHEAQRQLGFALAGALLGAWTGKTIAGVVDAQQKRALDPRAAPVIEAKERGKVAGAAAAIALAEKAKDAAAARQSGLYPAPVTGERPAMMPIAADHAQQWASGDAHAGVI